MTHIISKSKAPLCFTKCQRHPRSGLKVAPRITNPNNLSPELKLPFWKGGGIGNDQFPTFDAESKFAKIQKSHYSGGGGGGGQWQPISNFWCWVQIC